MGGISDAIGGVFGGGDSPDIPGAGDLIRQQAEARIDSFNPFGSLTFAGKNRREGTLQLTPEMQQLVDSIISSAGTEGDFVGALQDRTMDRLDQGFDLQQRRLQDQLTQSGNIGVGADLAPGAVSELDLFNQNRSDATIDALLAAEQVGQNIASSRLGQLGQIGQLALTGATPAQPLDVMGAHNLSTGAHLQQMGGKNQLIGDLAGAAAIGFGGF